MRPRSGGLLQLWYTHLAPSPFLSPPYHSVSQVSAYFLAKTTAETFTQVREGTRTVAPPVRPGSTSGDTTGASGGVLSLPRVHTRSVTSCHWQVVTDNGYQGLQPPPTEARTTETHHKGPRTSNSTPDVSRCQRSLRVPTPKGDPEHDRYFARGRPSAHQRSAAFLDRVEVAGSGLSHTLSGHVSGVPLLQHASHQAVPSLCTSRLCESAQEGGRNIPAMQPFTNHASATHLAARNSFAHGTAALRGPGTPQVS